MFTWLQRPRGIGWFVLFLATSVIGSSSSRLHAVQDKNANGRPMVVIRVDVVSRRIVSSVNSKPARPDLLRVLGILREQLGGDADVVALVDMAAPIEEIDNVDGVADKAGFSYVRFFVFNKTNKLMGTVQFGPDIPFSSNPPSE